MSTTPVPTTAAAHLAMVEALRAAARWEGECGCCGNAIAVCDQNDQPPDPEFPGCPGPALRAALEGWERRERLRMDPELVSDVKFWGPPGTREADAVAILDAVETLLFGERA